MYLDKNIRYVSSDLGLLSEITSHEFILDERV